MKSLNLLSALVAAITLSPISHAQEVEKCKVIKNGKNIIKAQMSDCQTGLHGCAGGNAEGEKDAWIFVPKGQCKQINAGNFKGVSQSVKNKIKGAK